MILDTNALSAAIDGDPGVRPIFENAALLAIPVIVLGEFRYGIAQSKRRSNYERWLNEELHLYQVLDVNDATSSAYAEIRLELKERGSPIPVNDLWIAALCRQHSLPILSRDRHFDSVKRLKRVSW